MVVCPTSTPPTSVMAFRGPVGRIPTFRPRSEARGRTVGVVFCAAAKAVANKNVATAKSLLTMGLAYVQISTQLNRLSQSLGHGPAALALFHTPKEDTSEP